MKNKKNFVIILASIFIAFIFFLLIFAFTRNLREEEIELSYNKFMELVNTNKVEEISLNYNSGTLSFKDIDGEEHTTQNPRYQNFKRDMLKKNIKVIEKSTPDFSSFILVIFYVAFFFFMYRLVKSQGLNDDVEIKKSEKDENPITFKNVAGLTEVKKDMITFVDFMKNKKTYMNMGAKLPKGIILYGPPGTGKTLLAKAVAQEADVPFFYMSGSDFVELFVGMGAKRVRQLFEKAKKSAPCIIFIDEIDAIGGSRNSLGSSSEDRKTINALLAEMDGFKENENILVIGATNRIEDLDSALIRPGRFTEKFCVNLPETVEERLESIKLYAKNKKFSDDVNFNDLARDTIGCSPADIEAIMNESAIIAVQDNKKSIDKVSLEKAMFKKLMAGHEKKNRLDDVELKLIAYHEAGHALVGKLLNLDVSKVTIIGSTSGAGGVTFTTPKKMGLYTKNELKAKIKQLYAGRCAEYMLVKDWDEITTGASNDIEQASQLINELISNYGMTEEFDMLNLTEFKNEAILDESKKIAKELKKETLELLMNNEDKLNRLASELLEKETLYMEDLGKYVLD